MLESRNQGNRKKVQKPGIRNTRKQFSLLRRNNLHLNPFQIPLISGMEMVRELEERLNQNTSIKNLLWIPIHWRTMTIHKFHQRRLTILQFYLLMTKLPVLLMLQKLLQWIEYFKTYLNIRIKHYNTRVFIAIVAYIRHAYI